MKKLFLFLMLAGTVGCSCNKIIQTQNLCAEEQQQVSDLLAKCDSLLTVIELKVTEEEIMRDSLYSLNDSIIRLNKKPLMTEEQFVKLYKYESLLKYYNICKRDASQWTFYRGWSTRVFED